MEDIKNYLKLKFPSLTHLYLVIIFTSTSQNRFITILKEIPLHQPPPTPTYLIKIFLYNLNNCLLWQMYDKFLRYDTTKLLQKKKIVLHSLEETI